ncbi:MAG: hypothetical protein IPK21_24610 [Haliscomenobacter sp.]|nr:hypothetical protein [Haliscomenobacter sp.]
MAGRYDGARFQQRHPLMNGASLLEQKIGSESFKFEVVFTLSQDDPWVK